MNTLFTFAALLMEQPDPVAQAAASGFALVPIVAAPDRFPAVETERAIPSEGSSKAPEFVFGTPFDPKCLDGTRAGRVRFFDKVVRLVRNARVIGYRAVLAEDNALYLGAPLEQSALRSDGTAPGREGFLNLAGPQGEPLLAIFNPVARERFSGRALFLVGLEHNNFGSFLFRLLPKILLARDLGLKVDLIVVPERMSWSIQALALANFDVPIMSASEAAAFVFDELLLIDEFNRGDPFIDPQSFVRIQALSAQARARHRQSERDRIYVSRRFGSMLFPSYRPLTNEREVESLMAGRGFRIATPEILSLSAQIALFANAQQIVGPSGSGMLNAMFAERGTPVMDIEGYTVVVRQHAKIYGSTGKPYGFVFGTIDQPELGRPQYRPWSVDCVDVARGLDHFASR